MKCFVADLYFLAAECKDIIDEGFWISRQPARGKAGRGVSFGSSASLLSVKQSLHRRVRLILEDTLASSNLEYSVSLPGFVLFGLRFSPALD